MMPAAGVIAAGLAGLAVAAALDMGPVTYEEWRYFAALSCRGEFAPSAAEMAEIRAAVPWYRRRAIGREMTRTRQALRAAGNTQEK